MQLKVGIIGFGGAGGAQLNHFNRIAESKVTAIYDPKPQGLQRAKCAAPTALVTNDFAAFLNSGINAVAVCSPDRTHADYVIAALESGKHVVCEKPLADSVQDCRRILQAEQRAKGVIASVQHQMRFLPVHVEMKRQVESGGLGRVSYIEGFYVHNLTRRASLYDDWRFKDNATPLVYSGCHFVDLLRWLLGDEVEEVMAMANHLSFPEYPESDLNVVLLRFKSGIIGKVIVAFGAGRPQDHSVRIYGTERSIENNLLFAKNGSYATIARPHRQKDEFPAGKQLPFYSLHGHGYRAKLTRLYTYYWSRFTEWVMKQNRFDSQYSVASYPYRLYPHGLAVRASLENFVKAIRGQERQQCSLKDAARTVAVCLAGVEAYRNGRCIKVSDFWPSELD